MKKTLISIFLTLSLLMSICSNGAAKAAQGSPLNATTETPLTFVSAPPTDTRTYGDAELDRALSLDIGVHREADEAVTFAEVMAMLDRVVELADKSKLEEWQSVPQLQSARKSAVEMTRSDGIFAVFCAAEVLGSDYAGQNDMSYGLLWEKMGNWQGKAGQNYNLNDKIFDVDFMNQTPKVLFNPQDDFEVRMHDAWTYSFGRISMLTKKPLFDYDEKSNTMRAEQPLLYTEAMLAVLRLYDSGYKISERRPVAEDTAFLEKAAERKKAILNSTTSVTVTGASYYVSNSGNDRNDGKSPETAWKTIKKALTVKTRGDGVFFERGGVFRGTLITNPGITYSAYGAGPKPVITTSPEDGAGAEKWKLLRGTENIWVFYKEMVQCGSIVVNGNTVIQRVCAYWDGKGYSEVLDYTVVEHNMTIGGEFDIKTMLPNNTFFNDIRYSRRANLAILPMDTAGKLYFRCDEGNPGDVYRSIEFSANGSHPTTICVGIVDQDVVIDNIAFLYAANGVNCEYGPSVTNSTIQNCEVGYVGGRVYGYDNSAFSGSTEPSRIVGRDGDGIMLMGHDVTARNNYVHDTWDHAFTIETMYGTWSDEEKLRANEPDFKYYYDITIEGNIAENCASLFTLFDWTLINTEYERPAVLNEYRDIAVRNNYAINNGYHWRTQANGGQQVTNRGGIGIAHPVGSGGIIIEGNTIYRVNSESEFACVSLFFYPEAEFPVFRGNVFFQDNYAPIVVRSFGTPDIQNAEIIYNNDFPSGQAVEQSVRDMLGDKTAKVLPMSK